MKRGGTKLRQDQFLEAYASTGGVATRAARKLGISENTVESWFKKKEFRDRAEKVKERWHEEIRAALIKRALEKDTTAAIFLLKSLKPEIYDDVIRQKQFVDMVADKVRQQLPIVTLLPEPKLEKPLDVKKHGSSADSTDQIGSN